MRTVGAVGAVFSVALAAVACQEGTDDPAPRNFNTVDGGAPSSAKDAGAADGRSDTSECKAKTCDELGPGDHPDDGCGNPLKCVSKCTDANEPNDAKAAAKFVGDMTDNPNSTKVVADLTLADGETDWFSVKVSDSGFGGNPVVDVSTTAPLEVTLFYACNSPPDSSTCDKGNPVTEADGTGCKGSGDVTLATECSGLDESGTAYIRVRKSASDGQCSRYGLSLDVK
jgi:hypothetical protein